MSYFRLYEMSASDVPTPPTGTRSFFFDTVTGEPSFKDDVGVVTSLVGIGVPVGGTAGQVLAKIDGTNFNTEWLTPPGGGDVVGPSSSVDNTLPRYDSTTGKLLQSSGVTVSDTDQISGYRVNINKQTGTSYTLQESDRGKVVELNNGSPIAVTADPTLDADFACTLVQMGTGTVTVASSGSGAVVNRQSQFDTAGQFATCGIYCTQNVGGSAAQFVFYGDTA